MKNFMGCSLVRLTGFVLCAALTFVSCGDKEVLSEEGGGDDNPVVVPPDDNDDSGNDDVAATNKPHVYDSDMAYDASTFLEAYEGTPYKETHRVPGVLEAEDFDNGGENVAYHETDAKTSDGYRGKQAVDIAASGASNGYHIGDVQPGEWMCYTIEADVDGSYSIDTYLVKGDGSAGSFYFEVDGRGASGNIAMPQGGWTDFSMKATAVDIQLIKGKHVLKYVGNTPGNVDRFVLTRTGDLKDTSNAFNYPETRKSEGNPLFTDFKSPMYNSWLAGPLYTADASAHVWNIGGREVLYVYASHDMEPAAGCDRMDRYHVFSTEDMVNWTDHGEILNAATVRKQANWGIDGFMWAPDCAYNPDNKLYYFYFPHPSGKEWNQTWRIGVAVSKYPDKEFHVVGYVEGMPAEIDPCVFVDDDGQPYIYNGGGGKCFGGKLEKKNWKKLDGEMKPMTGLKDFHEAAWVHKKDGVYYLSYSDNNEGANRMNYAISNSPLGLWTYQGIYIDPTDCDTNHGSIVQFKGKWYAFYHNCSVSGQGNLRSVCVDELNYNADGTIRKVMQTRCK